MSATHYFDYEHLYASSVPGSSSREFSSVTFRASGRFPKVAFAASERFRTVLERAGECSVSRHCESLRRIERALIEGRCLPRHVPTDRASDTSVALLTRIDRGPVGPGRWFGEGRRDRFSRFSREGIPNFTIRSAFPRRRFFANRPRCRARVMVPLRLGSRRRFIRSIFQRLTTL